MDSRLDAIVLDGEQRQSLVAVRSIGRTFPVGAFSAHPFAPARSSRFSVVGGRLPDTADDRGAFASAVFELAAKHRPRTIIATHDGSIEALRGRRGELPDGTTLALAPNGPVGIAVAKDLTLTLARELSIPVPRTVELTDASKFDAAADEVGLPAVIKPVRSWVQPGVHGTRLASVAVSTREQGRAAAETMLSLGAGVLVQQWLPGAREAIWFIYVDGKFAARFAQLAHRMNPPLGGSSVVRESIPLPRDATELAEALVAAAGLEGYSEVEFRRAADGTPHLMEINPRLSASVELAVRAGVDFPRLLYDWAVGSPIEAPASYPLGVRMRWLGGDIRWLRQTLRSKPGPDIVAPGVAIRRFLGDCVRPARYDYAVAGDLRPALVATTGFLASAFRLSSR